MTKPDVRRKTHPADEMLAEFLSNSLPANEMEQVRCHIASCRVCLDKVVASFDAVREFTTTTGPKKKWRDLMKKINPYLALAIIAFVLSFITPRYFMQLLVATGILGLKWVVDAKSTRMLVMIHEAWKSGGAKEASRVLERLETRSKDRF